MMHSVRRTYLDHNASSPLRPEALAAVVAALGIDGNPSSVHGEGRLARAAVEQARVSVARLAGAKPSEVVFTSGGTEANVWALSAGWEDVLVLATEHPSVLATARQLRSSRVQTLPVDRNGGLDHAALEPLRGAGSGRTLVSMQMANSETGVTQNVGEITARVHGRHGLLHTDATQALGKLPVDFAGLDADLMTVSAHKIGGPKGVGALIVRDGCELPALLPGGGQEQRRRAGTENVAGIAGFGAAADAALRDLADRSRLERLRDRLEGGVKAITPDVELIAAGASRLGNTSCIALPGARAETLVIALDLAGLAVSAGAACSSGKVSRSHVLTAMQVSGELSEGAIRVSLGWTTTEDDIDAFLAAWASLAVRRADRRRVA